MIWLAGPQCSLKHEWITTETLPTDFFQNALDTSNCYQHLISCGSGKVHMRCGWRIWFMIEHSELVSLWNHVKENNTMRGEMVPEGVAKWGKALPKKKTKQKNKVVPVQNCASWKGCENQGAQSSGPLAPWMIPSTFAAEDGSIIPAVCISLQFWHFWQHENICQSRSQAALGWLRHVPQSIAHSRRLCPSVHFT